MSIYFNSKTNGFYDDEIHSAIPQGSVEISMECHSALLQGQSEGKVISSDDNGYPILVDPVGPTPEQIQSQINAEARSYLASTDWYVIRKLETGEDIPEEILEERVAARLRVVDVQ